ncbi:MAG: bacillithiol biosynthesis BshC [Candidatus Thorarchaeota archaeon]
MTQPLIPSKLFSDYVFEGKETALQFWGPIPHNMKETISISSPLISIYQEERQPLFSKERFAELLRAISELHQKHDLLTPTIKENLSILEERSAIVEAAHQPALLGGPGFVINKIAAISKLASYQNSIPMMFVGDHDHEQKELTVIHLPSPGPRGILFSMSIPSEYRRSPIHVLPLPPKKWLTQTLEKIRSTYHELVASSAKQKNNFYAENIKPLLEVLETTYNQSNNLSDWTLQIWMRVINLSKDCGVLFQSFSSPRVQQLMFPAFEYLLNSNNRSKHLKALNQTADQLQQLGYQPSISYRTDDYVPFHLECPSKGCNRTRLEPLLSTNRSHSAIIITAQCPKCKNNHSLETKAKTPDLSEWKGFLSPRVDTRAFLVQSYTPVIIHVGGAGETSYYAQVSPALKAIHSTVPIFYRYSRLYYSNPWTRHLANRLTKEGFTPLKPEELQRFISSVKAEYSEENVGVVSSLFAACEEYINETATKLIQAEGILETKRNQIIQQQRNTTDNIHKKDLQTRVGVITRHRQLMQTYLSQTYGRYSAERMGQEVSFAWIDAAVSFGIKNHFPRLLEHYQLLTPSSGTFYLFDNSLPQ